jgi:hypothetical protein
LPTPSSGLPASSGGQPSSARADRLLAQRVLLALLRVGFTEPPQSPGALVVSYTTVSPLPALRRVGAVGGLFSVALSRELPRVGVAHHPALWSPDLPRYVVGTTQRGRPAGLSAYQPSPTRERGAQRRASCEGYESTAGNQGPCRGPRPCPCRRARRTPRCRRWLAHDIAVVVALDVHRLVEVPGAGRVERDERTPVRSRSGMTGRGATASAAPRTSVGKSGSKPSSRWIARTPSSRAVPSTVCA